MSWLADAVLLLQLARYPLLSVIVCWP